MQNQKRNINNQIITPWISNNTRCLKKIYIVTFTIIIISILTLSCYNFRYLTTKKTNFETVSKLKNKLESYVKFTRKLKLQINLSTNPFMFLKPVILATQHENHSVSASKRSLDEDENNSGRQQPPKKMSKTQSNPNSYGNATTSAEVIDVEKPISEYQLEIQLEPSFTEELNDIYKLFRRNGKEDVVPEIQSLRVPKLLSAPLDPQKILFSQLFSDENIAFLEKLISIIFQHFNIEELLNNNNYYLSYSENLRIRIQKSHCIGFYFRTNSGKFIFLARYRLVEKEPKSAQNALETDEFKPLEYSQYFSEIKFVKLSYLNPFNKSNTDKKETLWIVREFAAIDSLPNIFKDSRNLLKGLEYLHSQKSTHGFITLFDIMFFQGNSEGERVVKFITHGKTLPVVGYCDRYAIQIPKRYVSLLTHRKEGLSKENIDIYQLGYYLYFILVYNQLNFRNNYFSQEMFDRIEKFLNTGELETPEDTPDECVDFIKSCLKIDPKQPRNVNSLLEHRFITGQAQQRQ